MGYTSNMRKPAMPAELEAQALEVQDRVAKNFTALLKVNRWSARAAATALGLTHTYVNSRANGSVEMSISDLSLFAEFLNVPITRFFDEPSHDDNNVTSLDSKRPARNPNLPPKDYRGTGSPAPIIDLNEWRKRA